MKTISSSHDKFGLDSDLEVSVEIANKACELAMQFQTPLQPQAYEIWFTYLTGKNDALSKDLQDLMAGPSPLNIGRFNELHCEHLSDAFLKDEIDTELELEVSKVSQSMGHFSYYVDGFADRLSEVNHTVESKCKDPDLADAIKLLLAANREMQESALKIRNELESSVGQMESLRSQVSKMQEAAFRDELTSIGNRRHFEREINRAMKIADSSKTTLCLGLVDIDHFKVINDTHGHLVGDGVLKYISSLFDKCLSEPNLVSRFGGEEFAVIMPKSTIESAYKIMESLRSRVEESVLFTSNNKNPLGKITASFGVTQYRAGDTRQLIIERADDLLYKAKMAGRNQTCADNLKAA